MNTLQAGFSRVNVTPMLGISISGYYQPRNAEAILDEPEINALALGCGEEKIVLLSMDQCSFKPILADRFREHISQVTGLPLEAILIHSTHTHTGGSMLYTSEDPLVQEYIQTVYHKMADAAVLALADMKPAKMGWAVGNAPNVAFIRRYRMKDGSIRTNPGVNNPDIVEPIGQVDERVSVVRFDQEKGKSLVLVNYANHPDTVGGSKISCDWPGFMRRTVEKAIDDTRCIFFNGAQGDVNHVNVHPTGGFLNDMFMDFDDVARGYGHARFIGRVVAGGVLQVYDKVRCVDVDTIRYAKKVIDAPSNMGDPADLPMAQKICDLHKEGRDDELPYEGMMLTTVLADAARKVRLQNGPESFRLTLSGVRVGPVALVGIPGEPFSGIGRSLKKAENWELVIPMCLINGSNGYFPMRDAYEEGGYEAKTSNFKAGVAELIIENGLQMLAGLEK